MKHFNNYKEYLNHKMFKAIRKAAMAKTDGKCSSCGNKADIVHHHKGYPKPWGTFDVPENIQPLCHPCHCQIHGKIS